MFCFFSATCLLFIHLVAGGDPTLADADEWWRDHGGQAAKPFLERMNPDSPAALRIFDLSMKQFRERYQFHLMRKWSEEFEAKSPDSALGIQALAWRVWMLPDDFHSPEETQTLMDRLANTNQRNVWRQLVAAFPDDLSAILALRLLGESERPPKGLPDSWKQVETGLPETGVASYVRLQRGDEFAENGEWERAVDCWLSGLERYPVSWERPGWVDRAKDGLRLIGNEVQADILSTGNSETVGNLVKFRQALVLDRGRESVEALRILEDLANQPQTPERGFPPELKVLTEAHASRIRAKLGRSTQEGRLLDAIAAARGHELGELLRQGAAISATSEAFSSSLFGIAQLRADRGQMKEAVEIWKVLAVHSQDQEEWAAQSFRRLLEAYWHRVEVLQRLWGGDSEDPVERDYFSPAENHRMEGLLRTLRQALAEAETFAASASYSQATVDLASVIYDLSARLGTGARSNDLFLRYSRQCDPETWARLAETARLYDPDEAVAILQIGAGSPETGDAARDEDLLSLLDRQERFVEAARVARALAEEASGTDDAQEAWQKVALLEYKAGDYKSAETTLSQVLAGMEPGTPDHDRNTRLLVFARFRRGMHREAREVLDTLRESTNFNRTQHEELRLVRAYTFLHSQEYGNAVREIEGILADTPSRTVRKKASQLLERLQATDSGR